MLLVGLLLKTHFSGKSPDGLIHKVSNKCLNNFYNVGFGLKISSTKRTIGTRVLW